MPISVTALAITPVKGTRLRSVDHVELGPDGAHGNRRFFVIDARDRMVNSKMVGALQQVVSDFDPVDEILSLTFPDGTVASSAAVPGPVVNARFFGSMAAGALIDGACAKALSAFVGQPLRILDAGGAVDRGPVGGASLISRASLEGLAQVAGEAAVDARRFRMLVEVDGVAAHEEDGWVGRAVRLGEAVVRFWGNVGRCLVTSRHPETGEIDLATLDALGEYRGGVPSTEPLPFGIYGEVVRPGTVRVGDAAVLGE
jgi:MOSC domain-containing protein